MTTFSILEASSELEAMLHGTSLAQVVNINGIWNRAARQLLLDIDPSETKRTAPTTLYFQVYDYQAPADLKGNKVIDIAPQNNRRPGDYFTQTYNRSFDMTKTSSMFDSFTVFEDTGNKYLRIDSNNNSNNQLINSASAINDNGTWSAGGTATNLAVNSIYSDQSQSVLSFNATAGAATITNSTISPMDMSAYQLQTGIFFDFFVQDVTKLTSVSIKFGSSASDYWSSGALTTSFLGAAFINGFNQAFIPWADMTVVGSPDATSVTYCQITFNFSGISNGNWFAQIWSRLGKITNIEYYSDYLFRDKITGIWQPKVTDNSNLINLSLDSYNLFLYQAALLSAQQALGQDAGYDTNEFKEKYQSALSRYKRMYKSEVSKPQQSYYTKTFYRSGTNGVSYNDVR
jgi:hypothetical protein